MSRYSRTGWNDEALTDAATDAREILNGGITANRSFYLRGISLTNEHATAQGVVELWDVAAEGVPAAASQRGAFIVPASDTVLIEFPAPGLQFKNGVLATTSAGTLAAYSQLCWGYEEENE